MYIIVTWVAIAIFNTGGIRKHRHNDSWLSTKLEFMFKVYHNATTKIQPVNFIKSKLEPLSFQIFSVSISVTYSVDF